MPGDVISTWAWVVWLALIVIFLIVEVLTLDFTFLMLSIGSFGGLVAGLLGAPWWVGILVAGILAMLLLFFLRPPLLHRLRRGGDPARTNVDALLGISGTVVLVFPDGRGQVKLANGETWTSRIGSPSSTDVLVEGEQVVVTSIDGATAVVVPADRHRTESEGATS
ncbi:NfeD family protein [Pseudolysinimonas sp.]|uniref:NfeD family protein n=1 Tax=Pseudolysinimonas sp. TaxID=2680009 RepID=UPI003F7D6103